jgi:hypothetical protein
MNSSAHRQMACCMAGEQCDSITRVVDCCAQSNARPAATTVERLQPVGSPALSAIHPAAQPMAPVFIAQGPELGRVPADTSPPHCISFSVLLI